MAHNEHNKRKGNSGFALIIFGAMMFFLAPYVQEDNPDLAIIALIAGFIIGGIGFYIKFIRHRKKGATNIS